MSYHYVFGPVVSGRLGLSLGLDMLGEAICSLDCLYCEVGRTTRLTVRREPYVPARDILDELARWVETAPRMPEYVTLGGMGEPCLNSEMGAVIQGVRDILPGVPVAVLTNATLLTDPQVRHELAEADVVLPSMDSLVPEEFAALNRPHASLDVAAVADALLAFRQEYSGRLYLEVLLVRGQNDSEKNLVLLTEFCRSLRPHRVDVVTMTRPGASQSAAPVDEDTLARWRVALSAQAGPVAGTAAPGAGARISTVDVAAPEALRETIMASVSRRPQTAVQLACALGVPEADARAALDELTRTGMVYPLVPSEAGGNEPFYAPQTSREDRP